MAEVATAHLLLLDNSRETSTEKRKKREEEEGAHHRKTSRGKAGLVKMCLGTDKALWPAGTLAFGLWHRFVSALHRHGTSR